MLSAYFVKRESTFLETVEELKTPCYRRLKSEKLRNGGIASLVLPSETGLFA
jgi:hypothetical protein